MDMKDILWVEAVTSRMSAVVTSVFAALVKIKGDNSAGSNTSAPSPTPFKLLLLVLNEVRYEQIPSLLRCCQLRIQTGMFDEIQSPVVQTWRSHDKPK